MENGINMVKNEYVNTITDIINSECFRRELNNINNSYSNLKQEGLIRNLILEKLNFHFISAGLNNIKAFAEHPRVRGMRIDLSIINCEKIEKPFKIEFKYQFSKDNNNLKDYWKVINKDFEIRISDLFILVISDWETNDKKEFDEKWGITSNLSRYISKDDEWKKNIVQSFKKFENAKLIEFKKIETYQPYKTDYYFYILSRK